MYLCFPAVSKSKPYCCLWDKLWIVWRTPHSYYNILMSRWLNLLKIQNLMENEATAGKGAAIASAHEASLCPWDSLMRDTRSMRLVSSSSQLFYYMLPPVLKKNWYLLFLPFLLTEYLQTLSSPGFGTPPPHPYQQTGSRVNSQLSLEKNLVIVFPESKRVHFPTVNSATLLFF